MSITYAPPFVIPELRPEAPDWPLFVGLLGRACASGQRELESALKGMRPKGLCVEEKPGGYRVNATVPTEDGYQTDEQWKAERDQWLRPHIEQLACWLAEMWRERHPVGE